MAKIKMMMRKIEKLVPDTSVLIEGVLSKQIEKKEILVEKILIHQASLAELEHQVNEGKTSGESGLDEIKRLRKLSPGHFEMEFSGARPRAAEIKLAELGEIDNLIRELAYIEGAVLMTSDKTQASVAEAMGIEVFYLQPVREKKKLRFEEFFDENTMSAHIRENLMASAKKGRPGNWQFAVVGKTKLKREEVRAMAIEIVENTRSREDSFVEIERTGSTIIQLGDFRIVITEPPFSDAWEITAVRPVAKLDLMDYKMSEKLMKRLTEQAEGVLIAGAPGHGKTTFGRALSEYYASQDKIVKTIEAPRDMLLSDKITQYALSRATSDEIHDVLLLSRPDYTIFDEMRNTDNFILFTDLRLAGIGMVGVVHATDPIDAVQRFLSRVELGIIPHIIDTIVFIKNGVPDKVLSLSMRVKVPSGMTEADLARPIVEVTDFETGKLEYEIYTYGEQTVVVPVEKEGGKRPSMKLAEEGLKQRLKQHIWGDFTVEMISDGKARVYLPASEIAKVIGKEGKHIQQIEQAVGIGLDIEEMKRKNVGKEIAFDVDVRKNITIFLDQAYADEKVEIYSGDEMIVMAKASQKGQIKLNKQSAVGQEVLKAIDAGRIRLKVK